ncbi:MAG: hypothetical protein U0491_00365 [Candidatus Saccharimonadales bacterium]
MVERLFPLTETDELELGDRAIESMKQQDAVERRIQLSLAEAQVAVAGCVDVDAA